MYVLEAYSLRYFSCVFQCVFPTASRFFNRFDLFQNRPQRQPDGGCSGAAFKIS